MKMKALVRIEHATVDTHGTTWCIAFSVYMQHTAGRRVQNNNKSDFEDKWLCTWAKLYF